MKKAIVTVLAVLTLAVAGCSSAGSGAEDVAAPPSSPGAGTADAGTADAGAADAGAADAGTADAATAVDAAGGPVCDVLVTLYQDIITLPERVEGDGVTSDDIDAIMGPAQAMKGELPGQAGTVLPILKNDVRAATVFDTAAEVEEYFARGTHDTAMEELVKSTRTACGLPASWPEEG